MMVEDTFGADVERSRGKEGPALELITVVFGECSPSPDDVDAPPWLPRPPRA
jgi:hypothetical protein